MRYISWSKATTGTGASGEMRVTRPTMNLSTMASPMTRTLAPPARDAIWRARSGVRVGSSIVAVGCGKRQCHEDQEEHQELRVAEVVLEEPGGEHSRDRRHPRRRKGLVSLGAEQAEQPEGQECDEGDPDTERRQSPLGRYLQRHVMEVWI